MLLFLSCFPTYYLLLSVHLVVFSIFFFFFFGGGVGGHRYMFELNFAIHVLQSSKSLSSQSTGFLTDVSFAISVWTIDLYCVILCFLICIYIRNLIAT